MKPRSHLVLTTVLAFAMASPALAQSSSDTSAAAAPGMTEPAASAPADVAVPEGIIAVQTKGHSFTKDLVGRPLVNGDGREIGEIAELLIDDETLVVGAVLSVGGFLGLGSKSVAVPWEDVQLLERDGEPIAKVALTEEQLAVAPEFMTLEDVEQQKAAQAQAEAARQQQLEQQKLIEGTADSAPKPE